MYVMIVERRNTLMVEVGRGRRIAIALLGSVLVLAVVAVIIASTGLLNQAPSPVPDGVAVNIETPVAQEQVPGSGFPLSGTVSGASDDTMLWAVSRGRESGATYQPQDAPCRVDALAGNWACPTFYIGGPNDAGKTFDLYILRVNQQGADAFLEYDRIRPPEEYPGLEELPPGAVEAASVEVIRQ